MSRKLKTALIGLSGIILMTISLVSWSYKNSGPFGATEIKWSPLIWLCSIAALLVIPLYYCLSEEA